MSKLWNKWKKLTEKIGNFQAGIIFSLLYFVIFVPFGLIVNLYKDFLAIRKFPHWEEISDNSSTMKKLKMQ